MAQRSGSSFGYESGSETEAGQLELESRMHAPAANEGMLLNLS